MKNVEGSWKKKLEYFWMYYKLPLFAVVGACLIIGYFAYAKAAEKEAAFSAMLLDIHTDVQEEVLAEEFADYAGIDTKKYEVSVSTSLLLSDSTSGSYTMASLAKFYTQIGTESLDVCMMLKDDFITYAESDSFMDLREVFTEEELEKFSELYTDAEGQVLGIYGTDLPKIQEIEGYEKESSVVGILYNTEHVDTAKLFLEYLNE